VLGASCWNRSNRPLQQLLHYATADVDASRVRIRRNVAGLLTRSPREYRSSTLRKAFRASSSGPRRPHADETRQLFRTRSKHSTSSKPSSVARTTALRTSTARVSSCRTRPRRRRSTTRSTTTRWPTGPRSTGRPRRRRRPPNSSKHNRRSPSRRWRAPVSLHGRSVGFLSHTVWSRPCGGSAGAT